MSTSTNRIEANRRNAEKSTGPTSPEGKSRSRFNAVKHGMTARIPLLPGEDDRAFRQRAQAWKDDLKPRTVVEEYLVERAAQVSWQLDRADRAQAARLADARRAGADRVADLADEVLALGRRLFWDPRGPLPLYPHLGKGIGKLFVRVSWSNEIDDPNEPARIVNRLESTAIGCAWLLDRWGELRQRLEDGWTWQPPDRLKAIRMLGRQPMDAPQDDRVMMIYLACWAMVPDGPHGFDDLVNELQPAELKLWIDRLDDRNAKGRQPASPEAGEAELLELIADEEERLEEVLKVHLERDEAAGSAPLLFDDSESGERMRRYQLSGNRTLMRVLQTYYTVRREADQMTADPSPTPALPPELLGRPGLSQDEAVQSSVDASLLFGPSDLTDLIACFADTQHATSAAGGGTDDVNGCSNGVSDAGVCLADADSVADPVARDAGESEPPPGLENAQNEPNEPGDRGAGSPDWWLRPPLEACTSGQSDGPGAPSAVADGPPGGPDHP